MSDSTTTTESAAANPVPSGMSVGFSHVGRGGADLVSFQGEDIWQSVNGKLEGIRLQWNLSAAQIESLAATVIEKYVTSS